MTTVGHKDEAVRVDGMKHSFQKFKDDYIGIPNVTDAVLYTESEVNAYNALLTGALDSTTPLTAAQAAAYNAAVTGASKVAGDTLSAAEANAYNATLDGAISTSDVKTPAVPRKVKDYVDGKFLSKCIDITYSALKSLRDNSGLNPGQWYRITDYVTTTAESNTRSAGHRFDVVVLALDESTLCEDAYATKHEYPADYIPEDTSAADYQEKYDEVHYFDGVPLEAWKISYCLDNDTTKFAWAVAGKSICAPVGTASEQWYVRNENADDAGSDYPFAWTRSTATVYTATENPAAGDTAYDNSVAESVTASGAIADTCEGGKGVIYRMVDDRDNDVPYDFKNIMTKRWRWSTELVMPASYIDDATYNYFGVAAMKQLADMLQSTSDRERRPLLFGMITSNPVWGSALTDTYVDSNLDAAVIDGSALYLPLTFQASSSNIYATIYVKVNISSSTGLPSARHMYTFNYGSNYTDATVSLGKGIVRKNKIGAFCSGDLLYINRIVFIIANTSNPRVRNNTIGPNSYNLTFGQNTENNNIVALHDVIATYSFTENNITSLYSSICFSNCNQNTIKQAIGLVVNSGFRWNRIGPNSAKVCFGKNMKGSVFEMISNAYFGNDCRNLMIGPNCTYLYFGDDIVSCIFDNCNQHIIYGTDEKEPQSHLRTLHLSAENIYLKINCTDTTSSSLRCRHIDIPKNLNYNSPYLQLDVAAGNDFCTTFERSNNVVRLV